MTLRYGSFQAVPGGGSTSAVNSVNGKTGDVLLTNDDLNAQKKTSALPVGTADINDEVAFQQGGVSLRTAIENLPISLATRQALLGKLDASQKGTANGVAELDASGKLPVNRLPDAALGGLAYQGGWNAATNTPALTSPALRGYYWVVTTAGNTNLGGVTDWQVGDWVISNGTAWQKIDQTDVVTSVNGKQGAIVLNAADVGAQPVDATLTALAGLVAAANKLAYFTGDDQMALADFTAFARTLLSSADAAAARTTLDAQKSDATLTALAGLPTGVDKLPYFSGTDSASQTTLTAFARTLLDDADAEALRATIGLTKGYADGNVTSRRFGGGAGANIVYKRLATVGIGTASTGDSFTEFILSGAANIASATYPTYLVQFTSRRTVYKVRIFALASQDGANSPPSFFVYQNDATRKFELWCSAGPYLPDGLYIQPIAEWGATIDGQLNAAAIPSGATDVTATAIYNLWSDKSLVTQTSPEDTTPGAVMKVGAFGIGNTARDLPSFITDSALTTRGSLFRALQATPGGPGLDAAGVCIPFDATPIQTFILVAKAGNRAFVGRRAGANSTPTWIELQSQATLPSESGTFTPVVKGSTSDGTCSYSATWGKYTRIGDIVEFDVRVSWSGHTGTGNPMLAGLPFTPKANGQSSLAPVHFVSSNPAVAVPTCYVWLSGGAAAHTVFGITTTGAANGITSVPAAGSMLISGRYFI